METILCSLGSLNRPIGYLPVAVVTGVMMLISLLDGIGAFNIFNIYIYKVYPKV